MDRPALHLRTRLARARRRTRAALGDANRAIRDGDPYALLDRYWYAAVAALAAAAQTYVTLRIRDGLAPTERVVLGDSVIFEFIGIHLSRGGRLYETIWEVKPPVPFEITWLLATVAGEATYLYHALNLAVNAAAIVLACVCAAGIVKHATDDPLAAVVAGVAPFALSRFWWRATIGLKAKYLVVGFGLAALYLRARDRPLASGVASALTVGTWQLAVMVPVATLAATLQRRDRADLRRYLVGLVGAGFVVGLPVLFVWGTLDEMIVETVLVPLLGTEDAGSRSPLQRVTYGLGITLPLAVLGGYGLLSTAWAEDRGDTWPVALVGGWFLFAMLTMDYDTSNDLIPFFGFVAVGVGLVVGRARGVAPVERASVGLTARHAVVVLVCVMAVTSVVTFGGYGTGRTGLNDPAVYDTTREVGMTMPYNLTERQQLYWHRLEAPTCRVFVGRTQYELVKRLGLAADRDVRYWDPECGQWGPTWQAVKVKYGLAPNGSAGGTPTPTPSPTPAGG